MIAPPGGFIGFLTGFHVLSPEAKMVRRLMLPRADRLQKALGMVLLKRFPRRWRTVTRFTVLS